MTGALLVGLPGDISGQARQWGVSELILEIDETTGVPLFDVSTAVLTDKRVFVADNGTRSLLAYSLESGALVGSLGRPGDGPGEFYYIDWMGECAPGRLFIWDPLLDRISVVDTNMTLVDTFQLEKPGGLVPTFVRCGLGGLLVAYRKFDRLVSVGPYRPNMTVRLHGLSGEPSDRSWVVPGEERYRFERGDGPRRLGKPLTYQGTPTGVIFGDGNAWRLVHRSDVSPGEQRYELKRGLRTVSPDDLEVIRREMLEGAAMRGPNSVRAVTKIFEDTEWPEHLPPYDLLLVSDDRLFAREYPAPSEPTHRWEVFDLITGKHLGALGLPQHVEVKQISGDQILGIREDSLGAQSVVVFSLDQR